ncbi:hypothetical protein BGZ94_006227, partial [Podila epigama]
ISWPPPQSRPNNPRSNHSGPNHPRPYNQSRVFKRQVEITQDQVEAAPNQPSPEAPENINTKKN